MSTISRRAFLKTVGVGTLSVAAMSVLAGCEGLPTGTTPETPSTVGAIEAADKGVYTIGGFGTVKVTAPTTVDNLYNEIKTAYVKAYRGAFGTTTFNAADATGYPKYVTAKLDGDSTALEAAALAGNEAVDKYLADTKGWVLAFTVDLTSTQDDDVILGFGKGATSPAAGFKSNTTAFTATCDGKAVDCAISAIVANNKDQSSGVTNLACYVNATPNFKELVLTVAIPGADRALKYTVKKTPVDTTKIDPVEKIDTDVIAWSDK